MLEFSLRDLHALLAGTPWQDVAEHLGRKGLSAAALFLSSLRVAGGTAANTRWAHTRQSRAVAVAVAVAAHKPQVECISVPMLPLTTTTPTTPLSL